MYIDVLSDTHIDFYFKEMSEDDVVSFWKELKPSAKTLIIAGDIGHDNQQNIEFLKILNKNFYENILLVLGNHDYYNFQHENSFERVQEFKKLCENEKGIILLDGDIVEVEDMKFGGANMWYDGMYNRRLGMSKQYIQSLWKNSISDSRYISIDYFDDIFHNEISKLETIYKQSDVIITHVCPSIEHFPEQFKNSSLNGFFSFNGLKYLKETTAKVWIYGHTHDRMNFIIDNTHCFCNPLGYPHENKADKPKLISTIEIGKN